MATLWPVVSAQNDEASHLQVADFRTNPTDDDDDDDDDDDNDDGDDGDEMCCWDDVETMAPHRTAGRSNPQARSRNSSRWGWRIVADPQVDIFKWPS